MHTGTSGGLAAAADYAAGIGCECVQVFAKSPMQWRAPRHAPEECEAFISALGEAGIGASYTHTAYLLNLSGVEPELRLKSAAALGDEFVRAEAMGASGVVTHVGTFADGDSGAAAERLCDSLERAREASGSEVRVLLENSAGAGTLFLSHPDHFASVFERVGDGAGGVGVCLDTCHAHAAGHDLSSAEGWDALLGAMAEATGDDAIRLVHANDCAWPAGSRKDRHAWIGEGSIGEDGFLAMFRDARLAGVDAVMEMPGEAPEKDVRNLNLLKALRASCGTPAR